MKLERCPTHAIVIDKAKEAMAESSQFHKADVLAACGFSRYGDLIAWGFVRNAIERELGESLTPISAGDSRWDPNIHPEKFLPGRSRPTVGYARIAALAPSVATEWIRRRFATAIGMLKHAETMLLTGQKAGLAIGFTPGVLPQLSLPKRTPAE